MVYSNNILIKSMYVHPFLFHSLPNGFVRILTADITAAGHPPNFRLTLSSSPPIYFANRGLALLFNCNCLVLSPLIVYFDASFSPINLARFSASFLIICVSSPSIITRTNGSVPDGLINTLPLPSYFSSRAFMLSTISSSVL